MVPQDTETVSFAEEILEEKKQSDYWWNEENWTSLKKYFVNSRYPSLRGQCDEACLELGFDTVPKQTVFFFYRVLAGSQSHTRMPSL